MSRPPGNAYCAVPSQSIANGVFKCCVESNVTADVDNGRSGHCCPERGLVEFVCDPGYSLKSQSKQWICGSNSNWLAMDSVHPGIMSEPPKCYENGELADQSPSTDDMLKPVFGVAAGVLVMLSVVIVATFFRPKLIDMKRRWRKMREDEDELIIDGRRIVLPTYEEAVASGESYSQVAPEEANPTNHSPGPSHAQEPQARMTADHQSQSSREQPRRVPRSDEETPIPVSHNRDRTEIIGSLSQSLVLKAGTSADAVVVINQLPDEVPRSTLNIRDEEILHSKRRSNYASPYTATTENPVALSETESRLCDNLTMDFATNRDCPLESIHPQALSAIRPRFTPAPSEDCSLSCPLLERSARDLQDQQSFAVDVHPENMASVSHATTVVPENEDFEPTEMSESDGINELHRSVLPNNNLVHIGLFSQVADPQQLQEDEMGSTAV